MDILQKINDAINDDEDIDEVDISNDEYIFQRMADFILNLDPDILSDEELDKLLKILDEFERIAEEKVEEDVTPLVTRLANKSGGLKKSYARKWYRTKKAEIKKKKERMKRSAEGRKRMRGKDRMEQAGRTPTNKDKVKYNV